MRDCIRGIDRSGSHSAVLQQRVKICTIASPIVPCRKGLLASGIQLSPSHSSVGLGDTVCDQLECIPGVVEDAALQLFGDARWATESGPDIKVFSVIHTVANGSTAKVFQKFAFQNELETAAQKFLAERQVANDADTSTMDLPASMAPVTKLVGNKVEKRSLEKPKMGRQRNVATRAVVGRSEKMEEKLPT